MFVLLNILRYTSFLLQNDVLTDYLGVISLTISVTAIVFSLITLNQLRNYKKKENKEWKNISGRGTISGHNRGMIKSKVIEFMKEMLLEQISSDDLREPVILPQFSSKEPLNLIVKGPEAINPGSSFIMDIWAFKMADISMVNSLANSMGRDSTKGMTTGLQVEPNCSLRFEVHIRGMEIKDNIASIIWNGEPSNVSFPVNVPEEIEPGDYQGVVNVAANGLTFTKVWFSIVVTSEEEKQNRFLPIERTELKTAFASYASPERADVLARLQGIKKVAPDMDIFLDALSLRSGDDWEQKLNQHVPTKDIFYLFWSESASLSKWVKREWKMALDKRGLGYIDPVPLDPPDLAPPPKELGELHFNDAYLAHIKYEEMKKRM